MKERVLRTLIFDSNFLFLKNILSLQRLYYIFDRPHQPRLHYSTIKYNYKTPDNNHYNFALHFPLVFNSLSMGQPPSRLLLLKLCVEFLRLKTCTPSFLLILSFVRSFFPI